jgi:pimeloyl-ACP methyl ester carboxylesterase
VLHVRSSDGTKISYERVGGGPALLILGGSLADHHFYVPLAHELARDFTVYNVDRRGRGDSGDTPPYDVDREVDDVVAVVAEAGGRAHVYGHSAGSALALRAAAAGVGIDRLVLADPPFTPPGGDEVAARAEHAEQTQHIEQLNAAGDYRASVKFFLSGYGLPDDALDEMLSSPAGDSMIAAARVLPYDYAMLGDGIVPTDLAANVAVPTLVLAAKDQPSTARALAEALSHGESLIAPASMHQLAPSEIAALITPFLRR